MHKSPSPIPHLSQMNRGRKLWILYYCNIYFNIILTSTPRSEKSIRFPYQNFVRTYLQSNKSTPSCSVVSLYVKVMASGMLLPLDLKMFIWRFEGTQCLAYFSYYYKNLPGLAFKKTWNFRNSAVRNTFLFVLSRKICYVEKAKNSVAPVCMISSSLQ
jgi:hypothetical protein